MDLNPLFVRRRLQKLTAVVRGASAYSGTCFWPLAASIGRSMLKISAKEGDEKYKKSAVLGKICFRYNICEMAQRQVEFPF